MKGQILIVDDEELTLASLARTLKRAGYKTLSNAYPENALRHFQEGEEFDLVISDLEMPVMHGDELCKKVQELHPTPFILVSGSLEVHQRAVDCGAKVSFTKPYDPRVLKEAIAKLIGTP